MRRYIPIIIIALALILLAVAFLSVPSRVRHAYGPPTDSLTTMQVYQYSAKLLWYDGLLTEPVDPDGASRFFTIDDGQPVFSIAQNLQEAGLIHDSSAFLDYVTYTGLDTSIQAGSYELSPAMSIVDVAHELQDSTPLDVTFVILPGWRMEEIAASLSTSGLNTTPEQFLEVARDASSEGFLYPDAYILPRETTAEGLIQALTRNFDLHLTNELKEGFARQGLNLYQAVTLASILEREAIQEQEAPLIASVYLNRLNIGMKLDADPTVQYAIGFDLVRNTWWKNPLDVPDLQVQSPYNTYLNMGLPPGPISNPGLTSLQAVAFPAQSTYYFFRAQCEDSGFHVFSETFDQHLQNACP